MLDNRIMLKWLIFAILILGCKILPAQTIIGPNEFGAKMRAALVGEYVPDLTFFNLVNSSREKVQLADFKGKAVLIDFWALFCQPCLAQFPKLQTLQEKYRKELQIITVTNDSLHKVHSFFKSIGYLEAPLLTATQGFGHENDSLFFVFPHKFIPHYVWIDKTGILRAVTGYEDVIEKNIMSFIKGESLSFSNKQEELVLAQEHPALYTYQEAGIPERLMLNDSITGLLSYSMLIGYNKRYSPSCSIDCSGIYDERRVRIWNLPLGTIMRLAYGKMDKNPAKQELVPLPRTFFNIRDSMRLHKLIVTFTKPPDTTQDMYCYDLIVEKKGMRMLQDRMRDDMYRYFGVKGVNTKKKMWCYILTLKDSSLLKTRGGETFVDASIYYLKFKNAPFAAFVELLRGYNEGSKPTFYRGIESAVIVDETGFTSSIDIDIASRMNDIPALSIALRKYGLELAVGERYVDVLSIED